MIVEDNNSLLMTAVMLLETGMILLKFCFSFQMLIEGEVVTRLVAAFISSKNVKALVNQAFIYLKISGISSL